jgi:hypothetical protein
MEKYVKLLGFLFAAIGIGGMIAGYYLLPKKEKRVIINKKSKAFVAIVFATLIGLFLLAMLASSFSVKLF